MTMKRKRGRPSLKQELDINSVYEISLTEFASKGFYGAQLNEIAEKAGFSKSLMNYHFKNKEELWKRSVTYISEIIKEKIINVDKILEDLSGTAYLKVHLKHCMKVCIQHPSLVKILLHEMMSNSDRSVWLSENVTFIFKEILSRGSEDGKTINNIPIANFFNIFLGSAVFFFLNTTEMKAFYGIDPFSEKEKTKHLDIVIELLLPS